MILDDDLTPILIDSAEGEMIMAGTLLKGLSDEEIAWVIVENVVQEENYRITLHAYWHNIFMVSKVVYIEKDSGQLTWGATKV